MCWEAGQCLPWWRQDSKGTAALSLDELRATKLNLTGDRWGKNEIACAYLGVKSQRGLVGRLGSAGGSPPEPLADCTPLRKTAGKQVAQITRFVWSGIHQVSSAWRNLAIWASHWVNWVVLSALFTGMMPVIWAIILLTSTRRELNLVLGRVPFVSFTWPGREQHFQG